LELFYQLLFETLISENNGGEFRKMPNDQDKLERRTPGGNFLNKSKQFFS